MPMIAAATRIRARLAKPPMSAAEYLSSLAQHDLPLTAQALRPFEEHI
ncbi:MAG TPA: hypothetical protein VFZ16_10990 [Hyphomicrobiaceae bacterium]|nr:hypothetical protein [Hyphomicrobiaceae bacterium]